jgi:hypothetical protein
LLVPRIAIRSPLQAIGFYVEASVADHTSLRGAMQWNMLLW